MTCFSVSTAMSFPGSVELKNKQKIDEELYP